MLRDITIGQYYPSNSVIHKLDPRVKLFWTAYIHYFAVFGATYSYICDSGNFSVCMYQDVKSSGEIYSQRTEGSLHASSVQRYI